MTGIFFTARLGSKRLSEKHLINVNDRPLIWYLVKRFLIAFKNEIDLKQIKLFITTSNCIENKKFESIFNNKEIEVFYGSDTNIPLRHLECANEHNIDNIVSVDGDDILCSFEAAKLVIDSLLRGAEMACTEGLPLGMNCSAYSKNFLKKSLIGIEAKKLETGWGKIFDKNEIETIQLNYSNDIKKIRMTLDYAPDAEFFKTVISNINVLSIDDKTLIDQIIKNNWSNLNSHLDNIYWSNFNEESEK